MNAQIAEKIKKLRDIYTQPEDKRRIDDIEKGLIEKIRRGKLSDNPLIEEVIDLGRQKIKDISDLLSWDDTLTDVERKGLFREREAHTFWIKRLSGEDAMQSIALVEKAIDSKLE